MKEYSELQLGREAIAYVKECLLRGNTLAHFLLEELDLHSGRVVSFLPEDIAVEDANWFDNGGVCNGEVSLSHLVGGIQDFLRSDSDRCVIFENGLARPADPCVKGFNTRMFTFGNELYHLLTQEDLDEERIQQSISCSMSAGLHIGAMSSLSAASRSPKQLESVGLDDLRCWAKATNKVIVSAYDDEGYLIWTKGVTHEK